MIRSTLSILLFFTLAASYASADPVHGASIPTSSKILLHLDLSWHPGEQRETRVLLPDGGEATLLFPRDSSKVSGDLSALHVNARSIAENQIHLQFDWSLSVDAEGRVFEVIVPVDAAASVSFADHAGEPVAMGIVAEFASAEIVRESSEGVGVSAL